MRLRQEQARLLREIIDADIARSVYLRADAKEREQESPNPVVAGYNQRLAALRAMTEELSRLGDEMGWPEEATVDLRILVGDIDVTDHARFVVTDI